MDSVTRTERTGEINTFVIVDDVVIDELTWLRRVSR